MFSIQGKLCDLIQSGKHYPNQNQKGIRKYFQGRGGYLQLKWFNREFPEGFGQL